MAALERMRVALRLEIDGGHAGISSFAVLNRLSARCDEMKPQQTPLRNAITHAKGLETGMLKLLGCTAVAALFAIVQIDASLAQSAPAEKAEAAAAAEKSADKPAEKPAEKPVAEKPAASTPAA